MMINIIRNGRSTLGQHQQNDPPLNGEEWKQVERFNL